MKSEVPRATRKILLKTWVGTREESQSGWISPMLLCWSPHTLLRMSPVEAVFGGWSPDPVTGQALSLVSLAPGWPLIGSW